MMGLFVRLFAVSFALYGTNSLADCAVSNGAGNLGARSSFAVASTAATTQVSSGFSCTGGVVTILGDNTVTATLGTSNNTLNSTNRLYNAAANRYLPYSVCKEAACTTLLSPTASVQWYNRSLLGLLGLFVGANGTMPLYIRPATGTHLPRGTYTDTIPVFWTWRLCVVGVITCLYDEGSATSTVTLTLEVLNDCFIDSAPNVSFGTAALISAFQPVTQSIQLRCTPEATYRVSFDMGNHAENGWRRMINGTNALQYNLYIPGTSTVWNMTNNVAGVGAGTVQTVPYLAEINPAQGNVPAGAYTDTVRVIVTY